MDVWVLLTLAGSGLAVGFVSGLVGIGGGVLIVPLLYFFYGQPAWSGTSVAPELEAVVAHATSLLVIMPTSALGTWTYHRAGVVAWRVVLPIAAASVLAAFAGAQLAPLIPTGALKLGFGVLLVISGARLLTPGRSGAEPARHGSLLIATLSGVVIGLLSALLGVGGGIIAIPVLIYIVGLRLEEVAATSMAIIVFTAAAALIGYGVAGRGAPGLPPGSLGYIHVYAGLPILAGSLLAVPAGARANQRMETRRLRLVFGLLFLGLGIRLAVQNVGTLPGL